MLGLLKPAEIGFNLSTSNLSMSAFKLAKSDIAANLDVSAHLKCFNSTFDALSGKSNSILRFPPRNLYRLGRYY